MQRGCSADGTCRLRATTPQAVASRRPALRKRCATGIEMDRGGKIFIAIFRFFYIFAPQTDCLIQKPNT